MIHLKSRKKRGEMISFGVFPTRMWFFLYLLCMQAHSKKKVPKISTRSMKSLKTRVDKQTLKWFAWAEKHPHWLWINCRREEETNEWIAHRKHLKPIICVKCYDKRNDAALKCRFKCFVYWMKMSKTIKGCFSQKINKLLH